MMDIYLWRKICITNKEKIFRYFNVVFCTFDIVIFYLVYQDKLAHCKYRIVCPNSNNEVLKVVNWGVVSGIGLHIIRYLLSWMLFFAIKKEQRKRCCVWCYLEVLLLVTLIVFILTGFLDIIPLYYVALLLSSVIRVCGLWIVYYFSLDSDIDFDAKVYYVKKEEKVSTSVKIKNNNKECDNDNCSATTSVIYNESMQGHYNYNMSNYSASLSSLDSSRYYHQPV